MDSQPLLDWFSLAQRPLPWRQGYDPYQVWISEIMLQQTQVKTMLPYFERFMQRFPNVEALAAAQLDEVLNLWQGLGYYSRARNLWKAAQMLAGRPWPRSKAEWLELPGVGDYVSAAVSSIAFEAPEVVIDGNVRRVMARVLASMEDPRTVLEASMPQNEARAFNQALMELGALVCTPRKPLCETCPLQAQCRAFQTGCVQVFPVPKKRAPIEPLNVVVAILFNEQGQVFIQKRPETGLMAGLWEFPGGKVELGESVIEALNREIQEELNVKLEAVREFMSLDHSYTHFKVHLSAYQAFCSTPPQTSLASRWVSVHELHEYAFPAANRRLIQALRKSGFSGIMNG